MSSLVIKKLRAIYTGNGLAAIKGRRPKTSDLGILKGPIDLVVVDDQIREIGSNLSTSKITRVIDGSDCVAIPGFVDSHTHTIFGGHRSAEYFQRWQGLSYSEIAATGGGIHNTRRDTHILSDTELCLLTSKRLSSMLQRGTTTVEVKSGYSATPEEEIKLLQVLTRLKSESERQQLRSYGLLPRIHRTFLGLHALPHTQTEQDYVTAHIAALQQISANGLCDSVDAFPEKGFFSLSECLRFFKAAQDLGFSLRAHADEITPFGTVEACVPLGTQSVDHLQFISQAGIDALSSSNTVGVLLPATSFYLSIPYAPARRLIDAGARIALATDYNPGTAPNSDLLFSTALAASQLKMSPAEIFCAVSWNGAAALQLEHTVGSLEVGKAADIQLYRTEQSSEFLDQLFVEGLHAHRVIARGQLAHQA